MKRLLATGAAIGFAVLMIVPKAHADSTDFNLYASCSYAGTPIRIELTHGNHVNAFITAGKTSVSANATGTWDVEGEHLIYEVDSPTVWRIGPGGNGSAVKLHGKWHSLQCTGFTKSS
jgi:hypothetical protein